MFIIYMLSHYDCHPRHDFFGPFDSEEAAWLWLKERGYREDEEAGVGYIRNNYVNTHCTIHIGKAINPGELS